MYDGYLNRYSFIKDGRKTTLVPLSSSYVFVDPLKLEKKKKRVRGRRIERKNSEKKNEIEKKKKKERK